MQSPGPALHMLSMVDWHIVEQHMAIMYTELKVFIVSLYA
jgi:hypothetical protein